MAAAAALLSGLSLYVVGKGAEDEPYVAFRAADVLVQVGAAVALMLLWLQLAAAVTVMVAKRRISTWWLSLLVWVLVCEFYLFHSPYGYVQDITRWSAHTGLTNR